MIKIGICDDEQQMRKTLRQILDRSYSSGERIIRYLNMDPVRNSLPESLIWIRTFFF